MTWVRDPGHKMGLGLQDRMLSAYGDETPNCTGQGWLVMAWTAGGPFPGGARLRSLGPMKGLAPKAPESMA